MVVFLFGFGIVFNGYEDMGSEVYNMYFYQFVIGENKVI